jgi:type IX secretion system PorP/SprF family membrane protein
MKILTKEYIQAVFIIVHLFIITRAYSQDIHFSQYFSTPLILNPALTGQFEGDFRASTNYKRQWSPISQNSFKTFALSADAPVYKRQIFTGLYFYNDKAGDSKMGANSVNLSIASKINVGRKNTLIVGLQTGWTQRTIDLNGVTWDNQYNGRTFDPSLASGENQQVSNFHYFDISAGCYWKAVVNEFFNINAGIAGSHLNTPKQSFYKTGEELDAKWTFHGGSEIKFLNWNTTLIPSIMFLKQGAASEINLGMIAKYNLGLDSKYTSLNVSSNIFFGAFSRMKDAAILYFGYEYRNAYSMGISYDINVSKLRTASDFKGGTEIMLLYKFVNKHNQLSRHDN